MKAQSSITTNAGSVEPGAMSAGPAWVAFVILGDLVSMKNSRKIVQNHRTGSPMSIKSTAARCWLEQGMLQVPPEAKRCIGSEKTPLRAIVSVFYNSYRQDLDCALVYDLLELSGVVSNDRWIREKHEFAQVDHKNPRCEIVVEEI